MDYLYSLSIIKEMIRYILIKNSIQGWFKQQIKQIETIWTYFKERDRGSNISKKECMLKKKGELERRWRMYNRK